MKYFYMIKNHNKYAPTIFFNWRGGTNSYEASGEKLCDMNSVLQHGEFEQQIKAPIIFGKYRKWTR